MASLFSEIAPEEALNAKYESVLNGISGQKNILAQQKGVYQDQLYNYGVSKAQDALQEKIDAYQFGSKGLVDVGLGLAYNKLYKGSALEASVNQKVLSLKSDLKDFYNRQTQPINDFLSTPSRPSAEEGEDSIPLEELSPGVIDRPPGAPPTEVMTGEREVTFQNPLYDEGSVEETINKGGVNIDDLESVQKQQASAEDYNATIEEGVADGSFSPDVPSGAESGIDDVADSGESFAEGEVAKLGEEEAADATLDGFGVGEVLAAGSLLETGVDFLVHAFSPTPKPPPPPPSMVAVPRNPTFISAQVQSGL
jgi:hypothetical protein